MSYNYARSNYSSARSTTDSLMVRDQLLDDIPEFGSAFVCGKSGFEEGKFHVKDDPILQISCGDEHTGVVTEKGRVFMFGSNNWGQLGLGHNNNIDKPSCVKAMKHEKVKLIACGRYHTILATERGNIYSFGCNTDVQLGIGESQKSFFSLPEKVESIEQADWAMVSAGSSHSCALSKSGDLFVWGSNENGELGLGKITQQEFPKRVPLDFKVAFVCCGYYHTAVISKKGRVYTCGSNENFQLGHNQDNRRFNEIDSISEPIDFVACGAHHTILVTSSGKVYSIGDGAKGQLGHGEDLQKCKRPELIAFFKRKNVIRVAAGDCQTAFITDNNEIYTCGDNRHGKLGLDQKKFNSIQFYPHLVEKFKKLKITNVACGGCHMILIGKLSKDYFSNDEKSDEGFEDKRYSDRRFRESPRKIGSNSLSRYSPLDRDDRPSYERDSARRYNSNLQKKRDSSSSNDENEKTFNRTHTLTKDQGFVLSSELNLRKLGDDKFKNSRMARPSYTRQDEILSARSDRGKYDRYENIKKLDSDSDDYGNKKSYDNNNMKITPYVRQKSVIENERPLAKYNLRSLSDDESDYGKTTNSRTINSRRRDSDSSDNEFNKNTSKSWSKSSTANLKDSSRSKASTSLPNSKDKKEQPPKERSKFCTIL